VKASLVLRLWTGTIWCCGVLHTQVMVLMSFELVQSFNWMIGTIISHRLFWGPHAASPESHSGLWTACKYVGFFTYFVDLILYSWNACLVSTRPYMLHTHQTPRPPCRG
jgi:hypothetical protein